MGHLRILLPNQLVIERLITLCRVKRHQISTRSRQHDSPAETKPDSTICTHLCKTIEANTNSGQRLNFNQALKLTMPPVGSVGTTVLAAEF